jgi:hypothetical protein
VEIQYHTMGQPSTGHWHPHICSREGFLGRQKEACKRLSNISPSKKKNTPADGHETIIRATSYLEIMGGGRNACSSMFALKDFRWRTIVHRAKPSSRPKHVTAVQKSGATAHGMASADVSTKRCTMCMYLSFLPELLPFFLISTFRYFPFVTDPSLGHLVANFEWSEWIMRSRFMRMARKAMKSGRYTYISSKSMRRSGDAWLCIVMCTLS